MKRLIQIWAKIVMLGLCLTVQTAMSHSWTNLGSGINAPVGALAIDTGGNLFAGGHFGVAGGVTANFIAKWNGLCWTNVGHDLTHTVSALVNDTNGNIYAGGNFSYLVAEWDGSSWANLGSSLGLSTIGHSVYAFVIATNGNVYAGGYFWLTQTNIAKWDGSSWTNLGNGMNSYVMALAFDTNGNLYAGGYFTNSGSVAVNRIAKWHILPAPAGIYASSGVYFDKILVTWNAVTNATGYQVWRYIANNFSYAAQVGTTMSNTYADTSATNGTIYYYRVRATNSYGTSAFSSPASGWRGSVHFLAVPANYDGDARIDPAVYRTADGTWHCAHSSSGYVTVVVNDFGGLDWTPVPADYDGDGKADPAVYRAADGGWIVSCSASGYTSTGISDFGALDMLAVPADYDGDGKTDPATYRVSDGVWHWTLSASGYATVVLNNFGG